VWVYIILPCHDSIHVKKKLTVSIRQTPIYCKLQRYKMKKLYTLCIHIVCMFCNSNRTCMAKLFCYTITLPMVYLIWFYQTTLNSWNWSIVKCEGPMCTWMQELYSFSLGLYHVIMNNIHVEQSSVGTIGIRMNGHLKQKMTKLLWGLQLNVEVFTTGM
jgi:hypothetical protein